MTLKLYFHPLSSFCQKVLIALYENATPFEPVMVNFGDAEAAAAFRKLWPIGKIPVLQDAARGETIPETSIIIDYLDRHYPGPTRFVPADADTAREMRFRDRFFDLYVNVPMQKIVTDRLRPAGMGDSYGVAEARGLLATALALLERHLAGRTWVAGGFGLADCAAAAPLFFADMVQPFRQTHPNVGGYFDRLKARPSIARTLKEAEPFLNLVPQ